MVILVFTNTIITITFDNLYQYIAWLLGLPPKRKLPYMQNNVLYGLQYNDVS